jgi:hypothetical protein
VGLRGVEPRTSALSVLRSNQLSYRPSGAKVGLFQHMQDGKALGQRGEGVDYLARACLVMGLGASPEPLAIGMQGLRCKMQPPHQGHLPVRTIWHFTILTAYRLAGIHVPEKLYLLTQRLR